MSNFGKVLVFIALLLIAIVFFKSIEIPKSGIEGFDTQEKFLFKSGDEVYDDFYANIYDYLVYNNIKNAYEIGEIINKTTADETSVILDVGCGLGDLIDYLDKVTNGDFYYIGVDIAEKLISSAKEKYFRPNVKFYVGDVFLDVFNPVDITVLSGALSFKTTGIEDYAYETMKRMFELSKEAACLNFLSKYVDFEAEKNQHYILLLLRKYLFYT